MQGWGPPSLAPWRQVTGGFFQGLVDMLLTEEEVSFFKVGAYTGVPHPPHYPHASPPGGQESHHPSVLALTMPPARSSASP